MKQMGPSEITSSVHSIRGPPFKYQTGGEAGATVFLKQIFSDQIFVIQCINNFLKDML